MKNTLSMKLRALSFVYGLLMSRPVMWFARVFLGLGVATAIMFVLPFMVVAGVGAAVWMVYMSIFNQDGLDRFADKAKARKLRQGNSDDELRD